MRFSLCSLVIEVELSLFAGEFELVVLHIPSQTDRQVTENELKYWVGCDWPSSPDISHIHILYKIIVMIKMLNLMTNLNFPRIHNHMISVVVFDKGVYNIHNSEKTYSQFVVLHYCVFNLCFSIHTVCTRLT